MIEPFVFPPAPRSSAMRKHGLIEKAQEVHFAGLF